MTLTQSRGLPAACEIAIEEVFGWRSARHGAYRVFTKGYGPGADLAALAAYAATAGDDLDAWGEILAGFDGHFAFVVSSPAWTVVAADYVRSIPLAFAQRDGTWVIDDQAWRLARSLGLGPGDTAPRQALEIAMAGYCIGAGSLYPEVHVLQSGEAALLRSGKPPARKIYRTYRPWRAGSVAYDHGAARTELADCVLEIVAATIDSLDARPLVVPLSAGRDSRLIVSAARHLGYDNVLTFAYGRPGNHEAKTSKAIAERLGYRWTFVPTGTRFMRDYYKSRHHDDYMAFADTTQSVPFVQDLPQLLALKASGYIPDDGVLCNGNSGDFISGAHIVPEMRRAGDGDAVDPGAVADALCTKHFALWSRLQSDANRREVISALERELVSPLIPQSGIGNNYELYEFAEFQDRQCKYVISGQRIYEFLDHDWRLPLWERKLIDFFETVPLEGKSEQRLYADMLVAENWGGVWRDLPVNRKTIKPDWLRAPRAVARAMHSPLGKTRWHRFEKRFFQYWMENGSQSAIIPYTVAAADRRGARHGVAWLAEAYLARHGLSWDGRAPAPGIP